MALRFKITDPAGPDIQAAHESVIEILASTELLSIATLTNEKQAHINTAFYAFTDDYTLTFMSAPDSDHALNLTYNHSAAVTIFSTAQRWEDSKRGIQLFGACRQIEASVSETALALYCARFSACAEYLKTLDPPARDYVSSCLFEFSPVRLKVFDEPRFGEEVFVTLIREV